tara:strand:- start:386 stop:1171 length:786 start_codon:yes stop_codon:yes gene_type:complete
MPILGSGTLAQHGLPTGTYGYSAAKMADVLQGASEYTLGSMVVDASHSVAKFKKELEDVMAVVALACKEHPRSDNFMLRTTQFATQQSNSSIKDIHEIHGFKLMPQIGDSDYDGCLSLGRMTPLYDGVENAISATSDWARQLDDNDVDVNAAVYIITDGMENRSSTTVSDVRDALRKAMTDEDAPLESLITILIGVNIQEPMFSASLAEFKDEAGLTEFIELENAEPKTLAKLGNFISRSLSLTSTALKSGAPSQPISLTV